VLELSFYRVCWFCHFTGCVGTVILPGVLELSLFPYCREPISSVERVKFGGPLNLAALCGRIARIMPKAGSAL